MAHELSIARRSEADLAAAFKWYEERGIGLGFDFICCVEARFELIAHKPQLFRKRSPVHRMVMTRRFPHAIYFIWEEGDARVVVRRVLHFAQDSNHELR